MSEGVSFIKSEQPLNTKEMLYPKDINIRTSLEIIKEIIKKIISN